MIISEKQIFELMSLLRHAIEAIDARECPTLRMAMVQILTDIEIQQSEELKEIT